MSQYYKEAIGIIAAQPDLEAIAIEVAKANPSIFVEAAHTLGIGDALMVETKFKAEVRKVDLEQGMIPAIKFVRAERGFGLKEAKEYVEATR